jgi:hypothetical protein
MSSPFWPLRQQIKGVDASITDNYRTDQIDWALNLISHLFTYFILFIYLFFAGELCGGPVGTSPLCLMVNPALTKCCSILDLNELVREHIQNNWLCMASNLFLTCPKYKTGTTTCL